MVGKCKTVSKRQKLRTSGLLHASVKVTTVGNGNQIVLPRIIMKRAGIFNRTMIYLFTVDDNGMLGISARPPVRRRYKKTRLSDGGKFVIPRFFRDSQGIVPGTNLMFLYNGSEIVVTRLTSKKDNQGIKEMWEPFTRELPAFDELPGIISHSVDENSITVNFKHPVNQEQVEYFVRKLEGLVGSKLLAERETPEVVRISPVTFAEKGQR